ncbi:hypothetical protein GCM10011588_27320 [Nocardia jinanensis]|uniref:Pyridoxamine 5'-phosphate oxidase N-terminal domain-containing protein n=2 Tax=Nocardia jinanensis TaxID=382504 RepID=A0A917RKL2_9NOCA|nr:hypothetical protein GCM10011588_27320 [Nocardia jinanensis]
MVLDTTWHTVTIGDNVHCLEHKVTFADEAAWGEYRRAVSRRSADPEWESRRTGQDEWYDILDSRILSDPPLPIPLPQRAAARSDSAAVSDSGAAGSRSAPARSSFLLDRARFVTLATTGPHGPWAATVNFVARHRPLHLIWYSLRTAEHSANIIANPRVSGSMFMTGLTGPDAPSGLPIDGAQFSGSCREVSPAELPECYEHYYAANFPDPAERADWALPVESFRGDGPRRFYRLDIERWGLYDAQRWTVDKHDTRMEVALSEIEEEAAGQRRAPQ